MPRFRQTADMLKLMRIKERIRNVGVVAHIDHGKTTMTDSLLAKAGLLPMKIAGSARALDYLEEEQKRGITIKSGNISFIHEVDDVGYVINLVDTPGHVDFTGKVASALRAIDGVIVVVDAVEEIMAQTETVMRQALSERVRPVLFINKVDRLIMELRLSPKEVQEKFACVITDFNNILELYCEQDFRKEWKIDPAKGNVVFGSALHKWGFTVKIADRKRNEISSRTLWKAYNERNHERLPQIIPLHDAILDMVIKNIPSPAESQKYRVPNIWKGKLNSCIGRAMIDCDDNGPTATYVTATNIAEDGQLIATARIFSGSVKQGDHVYLMGDKKDYTIKEVNFSIGSIRQEIDQISAGNIAAVKGLDSAKIGETAVDFKYKDEMIPFEGAPHLTEPVMTVSAEPKNPQDLPIMLDGLKMLSMEDPSMNTAIQKETGQCLVSGMGELHLEVTLDFLRKRFGDVELVVSSPTVVHRESIHTNGALVMANSPNKLNRVWVQVEPLNSTTVARLEKDFMLNETELRENIGEVEDYRVLAVDEYLNILLCKSRVHISNEIQAGIAEGFHWVCRTGPLCEQPLRGLLARLENACFDKEQDSKGRAQIARAVSRAIMGSILTAKHALLEPIYNIEISVPVRWLGPCSNILKRRRGKVESVDQKSGQAIIHGRIPVAETIGLSNDMRRVSSGRAFWQLTFDHWEDIPEKSVSTKVRQLREERGLPPTIPRAEVFVDDICHGS